MPRYKIEIQLDNVELFLLMMLKNYNKKEYGK